MKTIMKIFGIGATSIVLLLTLSAAANNNPVESYEQTNLLFTYRAAHAIGETYTACTTNFLNQDYEQQISQTIESEPSNHIIFPTIMPTCLISCVATCGYSCSEPVTICQITCAPSTCSPDCITSYQTPTCGMFSCAPTCEPTCLYETCYQLTCDVSCGGPTICEITCGPATCSPDCYMTVGHPTCAPACQQYEYHEALYDYGIEI